MGRHRLTSVFGALPLLAVLWSLPAAAHPRAWHHLHRSDHSSVMRHSGGKPSRLTVVVNRHRFGKLDLNVKPKATEVWVDDVYHGTCDAYDGSPDKLYLRPGSRRLLLVTPDGVAVQREVDVEAGVETDIKLDLR